MSHKNFEIANTIWTISEHLLERMAERGIELFDVKCALKYGKKFTSFEDPDACLSVFEMDEADWEGQMTTDNTKATHIIIVHKKNAFGAGREILTAYFADRNCAKVRANNM